LVNPTRSKVKRELRCIAEKESTSRLKTQFLRECLRAARPMLAGRPHEAASNGSPRWMAAGPRKRVHRTRPTGRLARRPNERRRFALDLLS
jgi:hypothetical protein